ncbi:hypothetical protein GJ496_000805 [Pomphorhynchus laevis]|nr:hypothetical protein GJ496_000805 [Pomphorhynchus laevis]
MMDMIASVLQDFNEYYKCSNDFDFFILSPHNPLCISYQYSIAIMASNRHHCQYLTRIYEEKLLQHDDLSINWFKRRIKNSKSLPYSFKGLYHLNKLLAHRPWSVNGDTIRRAIWFDNNNPLSIGELMHAVYILANFHSQSGFIFGCGLEGPGVQFLGHRSLSSYPSLHSLFKSDINSNPFNNEYESNQCMKFDDLNESGFEINAIIENVKCARDTVTLNTTKLNQQHDTTDIHQQSRHTVMVAESRTLNGGRSNGECRKSYDDVESMNSASTYERISTNCRKRQADFSTTSVVECASYFQYRPMNVREKLSNHLSLSEEQFNWDLGGMEIAEKLFPDSSQFIDAKFKAAMKAYPQSNNSEYDESIPGFDLSDSQDSVEIKVEVQTFPDKYKRLRTAIWEYVQDLYGVITYESSCSPRRKTRRKEPANINIWRSGDISTMDSSSATWISDLLADGFLNRVVGHYVKIVATSPEQITKSDFVKILKYIPPTLLIMINIIIKEARFQCELLYALRAIHQYIQTAWVPSPSY